MHWIRFQKSLTIFAVVCVLGSVLFLGAQAPKTNPDSADKKSNVTDENPFVAGKDGVSLPLCYYMPQPPYPSEAKANTDQGFVLVQALVTADGKIGKTTILKSPGIDFDELTLKTMRTWKCKPPKRKGKPVDALVTFQVMFKP
jgi:TonB family protein